MSFVQRTRIKVCSKNMFKRRSVPLSDPKYCTWIISLIWFYKKYTSNNIYPISSQRFFNRIKHFVVANTNMSKLITKLFELLHILCNILRYHWISSCFEYPASKCVIWFLIFTGLPNVLLLTKWLCLSYTWCMSFYIIIHRIWSNYNWIMELLNRFVQYPTKP